MLAYSSFLAPLISSFVRHREASGRWNDASYGPNLLLFDRFCRREYPHASELAQEMVDGWCRQRDGESNNSCRSRIYVVVSFVRFLRDRGLTDASEPELPRKQASTYIPHVFTDDELARFFAACDSLPFKPGHVNSMARKLTAPVFFRLLYSSGMRTTEARLLRAGDVDLAEGVVSVRDSKGAGEHFVALHESMVGPMRRYDAAIAELFPGRAYFFPSGVEGHHPASWVQKCFRLAWDSVNEPGAAVPYELRHHYATENINRWMDEGLSFQDKLVYLSMSMGHTVIESTRRYYSITPVMADVVESASGDDFERIVPEVDYEEG